MNGAHLYRWMVLQEGSLPCRPDGRIRHDVSHVCTTTLVWPEGARPGRGNTLILDPCFNMSGLVEARGRLRELGLSGCEIGWYMETHGHGDHALTSAAELIDLRPAPWDGPSPGWPDMELVRLPGHEPSLHALRFRAAEGEVWVAGDAVLDMDYLREWCVYEPNGYGKYEILQTYRDVARILESADLIIPGHAAAIQVTGELLATLCDSFPNKAFCASECPDVLEKIERRRSAAR